MNRARSRSRKVAREDAAVTALGAMSSGGNFHQSPSRQGLGIFRAGYEAARKNRLNPQIGAVSSSADQIILQSREQLVALARDAIRNNSLADSVAQAYRRNLSYITPRASAKDPASGELLREFNESLDRLFYFWARRPQFCDQERRMTFMEMQGLMAEEFCATGKGLVVWNYVPRQATVGLTLQAIESEQLAIDLDRNDTTGNEIRDGIEVDEYGAAVAYWIHLKKHPLEDFQDGRLATRVRASRVIDFGQQRRVRQTHGVTRLASALPRLANLAKYEEAELLAAWMEVCIGLIDKSDDTEDMDLGFDGEPHEGNQSPGQESVEGLREEIVFEPGMVAKGDFAPFNPQHPGRAFGEFVKLNQHAVAASTGFDYSTITRHFDRSYSAARQGLIEEWKTVDPLQANMIDCGLGQPVWDLFVMFAALEGRLSLTAQEVMAHPEAYFLANWQPPARPWVDPAKEGAAQKIKIDYRLSSRGGIYNRMGEDWRDGFDQIAEESKYAAERGLKLPEEQEKGPKTSPSESKVHGTGEEEDDSSALAAAILTGGLS